MQRPQIYHGKNIKNLDMSKNTMFLPGIEPGTFRVLGGCDNHYTTETDEHYFFII